MNFALVSLLLVGAVFADDDMPLWKREHTLSSIFALDTVDVFRGWQAAFGVQYADIEVEATHYMTWLDNLYTIAVHNTDEDLSSKLALNQFGDLTTEQFRVHVHGHDGPCARPSEMVVARIGGGQADDEAESEAESAAGLFGFGYIGEEPVNNPSSVDWTKKGVVTPVKNQGNCGSCWAFSSTGSLECQYAIKHGTLNSLSEQMLVDCAGKSYGCYGCNGGETAGAMEYAEKEGGLCKEDDYKYTGKDGSCKASSCGSKYNHNSGVSEVSKDDSGKLEDAVVKGCVSVDIEADQTAFQHYSSGVLSSTCGDKTDHCVLVVGYGTDSGKKYWKVKNSWGTSWGEEGYIKICRECDKNGDKGECGILTDPKYPEF